MDNDHKFGINLIRLRLKAWRVYWSLYVLYIVLGIVITPPSTHLSKKMVRAKVLNMETSSSKNEIKTCNISRRPNYQVVRMGTLYIF